MKILFENYKDFITRIIPLIISVLFSISHSMAAEDGSVNCTITCSNMVFTSFNPFDANFEKAFGSATVKCNNTGSTKNVTYYVGIIGGNSIDYSARYLKNGTNTISYNMYQDSGYTQVIGDTSNGTSYITYSVTIARNGSSTMSYTIYGKVPVQPAAKPMTYTDSETCGVLWNY